MMLLIATIALIDRNQSVLRPFCFDFMQGYQYNDASSAPVGRKYHGT